VREQRATGSEAELNDEQWAAIQPLFFGRNGFYGADAAVEAQGFRAFHSKYVRRVGTKGGGGGGGGGGSAQVAPSPEPPAASSSDDLGLPKRFDQRYRVNHAILASGGTASDPLNLRNLPAELARRLQRAGLGEAAIKEVRAQLQLYEDFQQRKQLAAVQKLQAERKKLPVTGYSDRICEALRSRGVLVLAGATGCGKSTQIPQLLLKAGYGRVLCTQPRRLAAMALARRVQLETQGEYGEGVGYQVRFCLGLG